MEGVNCVKDGLHLENIVFISAEGRSIFQLFWLLLEASWVLPCSKQKRSLFEESLGKLRRFSTREKLTFALRECCLLDARSLQVSDLLSDGLSVPTGLCPHTIIQQ